MTSMLKIINRLKNSSLFNDSFWSLIGSFLGQGLTFVAGIVIARYLGKDIYGEYGMIKTTLVNIAVFSTFGLGYTATKFIAEARQRDEQNVRPITFGSINITVITSILLSLLLFVFSDQVAAYLDAPHLSLSLRIFAANIIFNALTTVQIGILAGFNEFKLIAINKSIVGAATLILSVVLTYFWGIEGALSALLLTTILNCVLNNITVRRRLKSYPAIQQPYKKIIKQLLAFSLPITLHEGVFAITSWLNIILLVKLTNYGEVGLYSATLQWSGIILFIPSVLRNVALSHLAGSNDNANQHDKIFKRIVFINFISTLVPCLVVFAFSGFISSFYGESFAGLPLILNITVFATIFTGMQSVYTQNYMSINKTWTHFWLSSLFNVLNLVLAYVLINVDPTRGAYMLALATLIISIVRLLVYHLVLHYRRHTI